MFSSDLSNQAISSQGETVTPSGIQFEIKRLYVKQQSTQIPYAPGIFEQTGKPDARVEMKISHQDLRDDCVEVSLSFQITMTMQQQTALRCDVDQAGIFRLINCPPEQRAFMLESYCPNLLHPYARKVVADLMWNAGFMPITLPAIDFEQARQQRQNTVSLKEQPSQAVASIPEPEPILQ